MLKSPDGTAQKLQSMRVSEHGLAGELPLVEKHCGSTSLIENPSWSGLTLAYKIELVSTAHDEASKVVAEQTARLESEEKRYGRFKTACGLLFKLGALTMEEWQCVKSAQHSLAQDLAKIWDLNLEEVF